MPDLSQQDPATRFTRTISDLLASGSITSWVIGICALTILLRIPTLASRPLWYDEAFSILFAREGPRAMLYGTLTVTEGAAADVHPLLYYAILWGWMKLFGQGVVAVRALSVILSVFLAVALILLARELFGRNIALITGVLYAISPFQIHYGQEARMYVLLGLLIVLSALFLYQAVLSGSLLSTFLFGLCAALAMYSHALAVFALLPLVIVFTILHRSRRTIIRIMQGTSLALLFYLPWMIQLPSQLTKVSQSYWIERPGIRELLQTFLAFSSDLPINVTLLPFVLAASVLIAIFVVWECWQALRMHAHIRREGILTLSLSVLPVVLLFGISQLKPLYIIRGLLPSALFFLLTLSWLLYHGRFRFSVTLGLCLAFTFLTGLASHYSYTGFPYAPFKELNDYFRKSVTQNSVILHTNKLSMLPAYYDEPSLPHQYMADPPGSGSDTLALPTQEVLGLLAAYDPIDAAGGADTIYLVTFMRELEDYERLGYSEHPVMTSLKTSFSIQDTMEWGDLMLFKLERSG